MNKLPYCEAICKETHRGITKESNCKNYARHTWLGKQVCKVHLNHYLWLSKKALDNWEIGVKKTREDILRMAREAGFRWSSDGWFDAGFHEEKFERFAALVAAAERDRMCEQFNIPKELAHEKAKSNETD